MSTSKAREYEELIRRWADALNDNNVDAVDEILAPDWVNHFINHDRQSATNRNRAEYKEGRARTREKHDDLTLTVKDIHVNLEDDEILERTLLTGTWGEEEAAENPWIEAGTFASNMNKLHRVENGKIAETWELHVLTETPDE